MPYHQYKGNWVVYKKRIKHLNFLAIFLIAGFLNNFHGEKRCVGKEYCELHKQPVFYTLNLSLFCEFKIADKEAFSNGK